MPTASDYFQTPATNTFAPGIFPKNLLVRSRVSIALSLKMMTAPPRRSRFFIFKTCRKHSF